MGVCRKEGVHFTCSSLACVADMWLCYLLAREHRTWSKIEEEQLLTTGCANNGARKDVQGCKLGCPQNLLISYTGQKCLQAQEPLLFLFLRSPSASLVSFEAVKICITRKFSC